MAEQDELFSRLRSFVERVVAGLGLRLQVAVSDGGDHVRIELTGEDAEPLLRRRGEALDALQHVVLTVFRHEGQERRLVVDCEGFRRARDRELRQMARLLIEKARATGLPQQLGPLNAYARRLVHLEVAQAGDVESVSEGEGTSKRVIIQPRPAAAGRGH